MRCERMTWPQVAAYFKEHDTVLIAIGSLENHGRQNPLGTDMLIPNKILDLMEERGCDYLIAPSIPYGACDYFREFPGTITIGEDGLYLILSRVIEGFYQHGARHFAILNGHGGNDGAVERIAYELRNKGAILTLLDWWNMVWDLDPKYKGGHGGGEETMGVMAIDESLVDKSQIDDMNLKEINDNFETLTFMSMRYKGVKVAIPRLVNEATDNGWRGDDHPKYATKELGTKMLNDFADFAVDYLNEFKKVPLEKHDYVQDWINKNVK